MKFYRFEKKIDDFEIIQLLSVTRSLRTETGLLLRVAVGTSRSTSDSKVGTWFSEI